MESQINPSYFLRHVYISTTLWPLKFLDLKTIEVNKVLDLLNTGVSSFRFVNLYRFGSKKVKFVENVRKGEYPDNILLELGIVRTLQKKGFLDPWYFSKIELPNWLEFYREYNPILYKICKRYRYYKNTSWLSLDYKIPLNAEIVHYTNLDFKPSLLLSIPLVIFHSDNPKRMLKDIWTLTTVFCGNPVTIFRNLTMANILSEVWFHKKNLEELVNVETLENIREYRPFDEYIEKWIWLWNKVNPKKNNFWNIWNSSVDVLTKEIEILREIYRSLNRGEGKIELNEDNLTFLNLVLTIFWVGFPEFYMLQDFSYLVEVDKFLVNKEWGKVRVEGEGSEDIMHPVYGPGKITREEYWRVYGGSGKFLKAIWIRFLDGFSVRKLELV